MTNAQRQSPCRTINVYATDLGVRRDGVKKTVPRRVTVNRGVVYCGCHRREVVEGSGELRPVGRYIRRIVKDQATLSRHLGPERKAR